MTTPTTSLTPISVDTPSIPMVMPPTPTIPVSLTLPVQLTMLRRGRGPGDVQAVTIGRYRDADVAADLLRRLTVAETSGAGVSDGLLYLETLYEDVDVGVATATEAVAAGWQINLDVLADRAGRATTVTPLTDAAALSPATQ